MWTKPDTQPLRKLVEDLRKLQALAREEAGKNRRKAEALDAAAKVIKNA